MAKYAFPAVLYEDGSGYSVFFPDIEGCITCGDDISDAIFMAEDALALMLSRRHIEGKEIPMPSKPEALKPEVDGKKVNGFINIIACDTADYDRKYCGKSVKKTLSIPEWMDKAAKKKKLNFSKVLQDALAELI